MEKRKENFTKELDFVCAYVVCYTFLLLYYLSIIPTASTTTDSAENKPTTPEKVVVVATNGELQHLFNIIQIHFILLNSIRTKNLTVLSLFIDRVNSLSWLLKPVTESTLQLFVKTILKKLNYQQRQRILLVYFYVIWNRGLEPEGLMPFAM
ncbi:unnamed protein product [Vicia faba]|uniref:Uncharacterized protein n=1 Tax=Vicia faba TaxID=3906 RepID=A0AAV0ZTA0_VICFA|nr:unnamed protein product [Vicia faba]